MFNEYAQRASRTLKEHVDITAAGAGKADWALGLVGEAGEVAEIVKHDIFHGESIDKMSMAKELGDVLWYISAMCHEYDIPLGAVADLNLAKLEHRHKGKFSNDASHVRRSTEQEFKFTPAYKTLEAIILKQKAPMNVIFVGPDGAGKSTIAQEVLKRCNESEHTFGYYKGSAGLENTSEYALEFAQTKIGMMCDRFHYPDDIVYNRVKAHNNNEEIDWSDPYWTRYNDVLNALEQSNTIFIHVYASPEVLKERVAARGDNYIDVNDLDYIAELYRRWHNAMLSRGLIMCGINTTNGTVEEHVATCVRIIGEASYKLAGLDVPDEYLTPVQENETIEIEDEEEAAEA
ncbi:MAG: MazG nucleotide pyrophosphohydrolase domain-containing protein [Eubacteriales bacterium]